MVSGPHGAQRKVLFLVPFPPRLDATHGGARVTAQLLDGLAESNRLGLLVLRGQGEPPVDDELRTRCDFVREIDRPWSGMKRSAQLVRDARLIAGLARLRPMWMTDVYSQPYASELQSLVRGWRPDILHVQQHVMAQYLSALEGCGAGRVLSELEVSARAAPYLKRDLPILGGALARVDALAWRRLEPRLIRHVHATVVFTDADRAALEHAVPGARILTIPFGAAIPENPLSATGCPPPRLLFFGNYLHGPNIEAAVRLGTRIFPRVRARVPDARLEIIGDHPPPELTALASPHILVAGFVPEMSPYLDRAAVCVAPLSLGGGMRVKVAEALAAGKAVIASRLATEGLTVKHARELLIADTDSEFTDAIVRLLVDTHARRKLGARARAWAASNLSWGPALSAYERLYQSLGDNKIC